MLSETNSPARQSYQWNVRCYVTQNVFYTPFKKFVAFEVSFKVGTVFDKPEGDHEIRQLLDGRVGNLLVGFVQLLGEFIFVNFFQGFIGSLFDLLCRVFDLSFCDQPKNFFAVVHHLLVFFFHLFRDFSPYQRKNTSRRLNPRECWSFRFRKATSCAIQEVSVRTRPSPVSALKTGCKPLHCLTRKKDQSFLGDRHNVKTPLKNVCCNRTPGENSHHEWHFESYSTGSYCSSAYTTWWHCIQSHHTRRIGKP